MNGNKRVLIIIGAAAVVYLIFKYIIPLAAPFVIAFLFAAALNRQVGFLSRRIRLKRSMASVVLIIFWGSVLSGLIYLLGGLLITQVRNVIENYELYYSYINEGMCSFCAGVDGVFGFVRGTTLSYIDSGLMHVMQSTRDRMMPSIMGGSISALKGFITISGVAVIFFMALYFFLKDYENIKAKMKNSEYAEEFEFFYGRMGKILYTFIRTQLIVMTITMIICSIGLIILRNPYWLLLGVVLGLVDALPVFGTGTILIPWAVVSVICGKYKYAAALLIICFVSYVVREYLEPKLMGKGLGAHPLGMLAAVYAGLVLFGVAGVITGPIAFIFIREISAFLSCRQERA